MSLILVLQIVFSSFFTKFGGDKFAVKQVGGLQPKDNLFEDNESFGLEFAE